MFFNVFIFSYSRFTCFPGDFDGDEKSKGEADDDEDDDDPWESRTREISFGNKRSSFETSASLSPINHSPNKTDETVAIVDASSPSSKDHFVCSSSEDEDEKEEEEKQNSMDVEEGSIYKFKFSKPHEVSRVPCSGSGTGISIAVL